MNSLRVLVIDDEPAVRQIMASHVKQAGYNVDQAASAAEAAAKLVRGDVDVALCDIQLPDGNGIDLVKNTRASGIDTTFIMVTAFASTETAIEALRAGAADYITKPLRTEELLHRLSQIVSLRSLRKENTALRKAVTESSPKLFRFASTSMREVERLASRVAPTASTVLITGESGTGKGVIARSLHAQSGRIGGNFVSVNCGAIPETMLESEFFGHMKGAFTGADRARKGLFVEADGGTLFLDEIGELTLHMQTKLLHVIEEKEVRALGGEQSRRVDVRIIAATNRDLQQMVANGKFREDLYFRLGMFHIHVPPLRERQEDLRGLILHVLSDVGNERETPRSQRIDAAAEELLLAYRWPGNVREIENVLNRAHLMADGDCITLADIPPQITRALAESQATASPVNQVSANLDNEVVLDGNLRDNLRRFEAQVISLAIAAAGGDRRQAANKLGIGLSSLYRKLEEFSPTSSLEEGATGPVEKS
ncbi:MAG: sigma-54-dependent Fis family transcriptional regulator [Betaproteobacteria bacterium]|nr:sigma-54-dependent Fis family transcriptional regulator [Betaproteobacteria bacterium]